MNTVAGPLVPSWACPAETESCFISASGGTGPRKGPLRCTVRKHRPPHPHGPMSSPSRGTGAPGRAADLGPAALLRMYGAPAPSLISLEVSFGQLPPHPHLHFSDSTCPKRNSLPASQSTSSSVFHLSDLEEGLMSIASLTWQRCPMATPTPSPEDEVIPESSIRSQRAPS